MLEHKKLLDLIGSIEAPNGYDTVYGNNMRRMKKPLTSMTMKEVLDQGRWRTNEFGSSACGRYQFMDRTLRDLAAQLDLKADDQFTAEYQDRLGLVLLRRRGYDKWARGEMSHDAFMIQLAREWASFPVPYDMKVGSRYVKRGQSYYAGDGLNKSLITPEKVWLFLRDMQQAAKPLPEPEPPLDVGEVDSDTGDNPFWTQLKEAIEKKDVKMLQAALAPIIAAALQEALRRGFEEAKADPNTPDPNPQVQAKVEAVVRREMEPRIEHITNTEEWWRKRSVWAAIVAGAAPLVALAGWELAPDQQEYVVTAVLFIMNGVAAYLARRAGTASKPLGR